MSAFLVRAIALGAGLCAAGDGALAQSAPPDAAATPALAAPAAEGQPDAPREVPTLETVTVIGTGLPTELLRNPASITVISAEQIEQGAPVSIAALLRDVPGVQVSEEGIERIGIRGEGARRVAILIDGQKLTDHTNYGQPVLLDPTTIERIEVVRGSSSVVSGSSAIGGVINIVTRRGAPRPFGGSVTAGYLAATRGWRAAANLGGTVQAGPGALDYTLNLGRMKQGDRRAPDGRLRPSDVRDRNVSGHLGWRVGAHYFGIRAQAYDLAANVYVGMPDLSIALPRHDLRKTSLFYEGTGLAPWLTRLSASVYRQTIERDFRNDVTASAGRLRIRVLSDSIDEQATKGANLRAEMKFSPASRTVAGIEWEDDGLVTDKTTRTTRTPPGTTTTTLRHDNASARTAALFAQHEIRLGEQWTANVGARAARVRSGLDASSTNGVAGAAASSRDHQVLGSAGLVWSPSRQLALRANVSQSYIYPTLGQLFLTTTGGGSTLVGNPDLKPERSTTFELGARYAEAGTLLDATLFHARASDYIATVARGATGTYENVDAARSTGLELTAERTLGAWRLAPYGSIALMRRELRYGNGYSSSDGGTPRVSGRIGLRKDWRAGPASGSADLYLRGESAARLRAGDGTLAGSASGWATLNLRAHVEFRHGLTLVAEAVNLTNRRYAPYAQMPGAERSINLFLTQKF